MDATEEAPTLGTVLLGGARAVVATGAVHRLRVAGEGRKGQKTGPQTARDTAGPQMARDTAGPANVKCGGRQPLAPHHRHEGVHMSFEAILAKARSEGRTLLSEVEAKEVLREAGVPVTATTLATSADEAVAQAEAAGYPVVLKVVSPDISHKSDAGGVKLNLESGEDVRTAYSQVLESCEAHVPGARITGVAVQHMAPQGTEVIVGMTTDAQFGPVMMFGLGGIMVEVLKDVSFRLVPLEEKDARQMIGEIKGKPILEGVRGQPPADTRALEDTLLKVSKFVEEHPQVRELDLNPVFAYPEGAVAVDARIVVSEA